MNRLSNSKQRRFQLIPSLAPTARQDLRVLAKLALTCTCLWMLSQANTALAQTPPQPTQPPRSASALPPQADNAIEPPGRVAYVSYAFGNIGFSDAGTQVWSQLQQNRPLSSGDSLKLAEDARAELLVGANVLRLAAHAKLSFILLDDDSTQIHLSHGSLAFKVRALQDKESFEIATPNLRFLVQEPGDYRINVNSDDTTTVIVRSGIGVAQGERDIITLRAGETSRFYGQNLHHTQIARHSGYDSFDQWVSDRDRADEQSISARYIPRDMMGYRQLDDHGTWDTHIDYGPVWYPRVITSNWAPYRDGHWVWISPWGWTWVDRSPWGFAPYHYGRWAFIGKRWGWVPGRWERHHRPVYAPALVAFIGLDHHGVSVGVKVGHRYPFGPSVSWLPLGPGEIYRPHYHHSDHYRHRVNQTIVINNTTIINDHRPRYRNQSIENAVTSVPTDHFVRGDYVSPHATRIKPTQIKHIQDIQNANLIQPAQSNRYGDERPRHWQDSGKNLRHPVTNQPERQERAQSHTPFNSAEVTRPYANSRIPGSRVDGTAQSERLQPVQNTTAPHPQRQSDSGIRTLEEGQARTGWHTESAERAERQPRIERMEQQERFDNSRVQNPQRLEEQGRIQVQPARVENKFDTPVRREAIEDNEARMPRHLQRKLESSGDHSSSSPGNASFPAMIHERPQTREQPRMERAEPRVEERMERSGNRWFDRQQEREHPRAQPREMPVREFQTPQPRETMVAPRVEPRAMPAEVKREGAQNNHKVERDKDIDKRKNDRYN